MSTQTRAIPEGDVDTMPTTAPRSILIVDDDSHLRAQIQLNLTYLPAPYREESATVPVVLAAG